MPENDLQLYSERRKILPQMGFEHTPSEWNVQRAIPLCHRGMHVCKTFQETYIKKRWM